jgi:hypothetical protein
MDNDFVEELVCVHFVFFRLSDMDKRMMTEMNYL